MIFADKGDRVREQGWRHAFDAPAEAGHACGSCNTSQRHAGDLRQERGLFHQTREHGHSATAGDSLRLASASCDCRCRAAPRHLALTAGAFKWRPPGNFQHAAHELHELLSWEEVHLRVQLLEQACEEGGPTLMQWPRR